MMRYNRFFEIFSIIAFFALLGAAIFMMISFYVCDNQTCKPFQTASESGPTGSKNYVLTLLDEFATDGVWPFPYIGAAILTPLCLWFIGYPITLTTFAILFFTSFVIIYFMFSFYNHHYIRFISDYVQDYINQSCPNTSTDDDSIQVTLAENIENRTSSSPVNRWINTQDINTQDINTQDIENDSVCYSSISPDLSRDLSPDLSRDSTSRYSSRSARTVRRRKFKTYEDGVSSSNFSAPVNIF